MKTWSYFEPGLCEIAGVDILKVVWRAARQKETRYEVRFLCCDTVEEITHKKLQERISKASKSCGLCARGRRYREQGYGERLGVSSKDWNVTPPSWPVPRLE